MGVLIRVQTKTNPSEPCVRLIKKPLAPDKPEQVHTKQTRRRRRRTMMTQYQCKWHGLSSATAAPAPRAEETKSLVKSSRQHQRRKRGRLGQAGLASAASAEWKPSLCSISEDNMIVGKSGDDRTAGAERVVKRKSGPGNARVHVRSFNDDYG
ncbi:hypothetical protein FNV43_RR03994 [Rhamnella rubrinervis]|uniref:Uncharacterized protein n=1 Tax=Rhamnella rubrinervis TaxID=2594499 RepID=A0A8K0HKZ3_9ROSA|nr:hypothetical protein FNV43_RR03994 [Rhamnella rubrinervis]